MAAYDAVVVGAGPNGLAAAIALAQAGKSVLVVEARDTVGGGCRSAELTLPGFLHDTCSAIHPLGLGSPFFRTLPLGEHGLEWIQPPAPVAHPNPAGLAPNQPDWKVLIVDDVPTNRELLDELLSGMGFFTRTAASAEEAIVVHDEWRPHLVLMDLRMPGTGGLEAIRRLRRSGSKAPPNISRTSISTAPRRAPSSLNWPSARRLSIRHWWSGNLR